MTTTTTMCVEPVRPIEDARAESETSKNNSNRTTKKNEKGREKNDRYRIKRRLVERLRFVFNSLFCVDSSFAHLPPFTFPSRLHRSHCKFPPSTHIGPNAQRTTDDPREDDETCDAQFLRCAAFALIMDLNSLV